MIFNSLVFVVFFVVVLLVHHVAPLSWRSRKTALLGFSLLFYAAWNPPFVLLLVVSIGLDWGLARAMVRHAPASARRRALLGLSLLVNLGLLAYFKYAGFMLESFVSLASSLGVTLTLAKPDIILPIGISFYTFQTLSYTIDVYRDRVRPCDSLLDFALFVSFFPQLVAGPIVRASEFLPQLDAPRPFSGDQLGLGLAFLTLGLGSKCVLADRLLGPIADKVYAPGVALDFFDGWCGTVAFAGQVFCDFSGYSMCAIGAAMALGFSLPRNFHFPYGAVGFSEVWRRWHMSLSSWLRDYVYFSLGGSRTGTIRLLVNLQIVMLIVGLWHGASWNFVLWGAMHGLLLTLERGLRAVAGRLGVGSLGPFGPLACVLTFLSLCFTWVLFRSATVADAGAVLRSLVGLGDERGHVLTARDQLTAMVVVGALVGAQWFASATTLEAIAARIPWYGRSTILALVLLALILTSGAERAFIYFQF